MRDSLSVRLTLVLAGLFLFLGVIFVVILRHFSDTYRDEVNQRMNADLAMYIARENRTIGGSAIDLPGLTTLLPYVMKVNPAAEVYVLDPSGRVLAYSGATAPQRDSVDLAPVRAFLAQTQPLPILGTNPRQPGTPRIFSAATLGDAAAPSGYVYAVIGAASEAATSRGAVLSLAAIAFIASLLFALVTGLVLFHSLTGRLRRLADAVDRFRAAPMQEPLPLPGIGAADRGRRGDEIARLDSAFAELSHRIADQLHTLQRIDHDRRTALAHASHDLRTPLTALQGYLQTLAVKGGELNEAQRAQYLTVALKHSERLGCLIEQVFALAKLDDPDAQPSRERFSLGELAGDIAEKHRLHAEAAGVRLQADIAIDAPPVCADIAMFGRLIENLLDNALKFTPAGGQVRVAVRHASGFVTLEIADTGRGISAEELPRVFDRFYRGQEARGPSSGLGLAIVKRVAELHAVPVDVTSTTGSGTRFALTIAAADAAAAEAMTTSSRV